MPVLRVRSGPQQGTQWRLSRSVAARIGSDPSCEICINGDGVERRQAVVHYVTGRWLIESLGSAGLRINDNAPSQLAWLEPDDRIQLLPGSVVVEFLSTSLKRAKGRRTPTGRTTTFAKLLPGIGGSATPDGKPQLADDVRKKMFWPALACGGIVAISAITALAVVVLAGMVLLSQQERRAESHSDGPLASKAGDVQPKETPPSTIKTEPEDKTAPPEDTKTPVDKQPETPVVTPPATNTPPSTAVATAAPSTANPPVTPTPPNTTPTPSTPPAPVVEPGSDQFWKLFDAGMFLIEVTNPGTKQTAPFGAAWAVGELQLVTTAGQAVELANFLKEGWRVVVVRQSDQGRVAVKQSVAHPEYEKLTGQRMQMFYDVGLLTIENSTTLAFELPSSEDFDHLEAGAAVTCLGIPNGFDPMVSATSLQVNAFPGKLHLLERLNTGGPALLHLNIELPEHLEGSPIFTAQGKVIGLYNRAAPPEVQKKLGFPLHAATSVLPVKDLLPKAPAATP